MNNVSDINENSPSDVKKLVDYLVDYLNDMRNEGCGI